MIVVCELYAYRGRAKLPTICKDVHNAMDAIEKGNPSLRSVMKVISILSNGLHR